MEILEKSANPGRFAFVAPPRPLGPYVDHIRRLQLPAASVPYVRLPDNRVDIVLRRGAVAITASVVGPQSAAFRKPTGDGGDDCLVLRFRPGGAYSFLGGSIADLTDRVVALTDLWPISHTDPVYRVIETSADPSRWAATLCRVLTCRVRRRITRAEGKHPARTMHAIRAAGTTVPVQELAQQLGFSVRQLRRTFVEEVGVSPVRYRRALRLERVLALATATRPNWAAIAHSTGYTDQAHMINDVRSLTGVTPSALRALPAQTFARSILPRKTSKRDRQVGEPRASIGRDSP